MNRKSRAERPAPYAYLKGKRVGAVAGMDEDRMYLLGYGTYVGDELLDGVLSSPKIVLDDGKVVWGLECWWFHEDALKRAAAEREVIKVDIDELRAARRSARA